MLKSPITKTGEVRYVEVIKYTVLIALFSYGYILLANTNLLMNLFSGINAVFVLLFTFMSVIVLSSTVQLLNLLRRIVTPIIRYIRRQFVIFYETVVLSVFKLDKVVRFDSRLYSKLCVVRC